MGSVQCGVGVRWVRDLVCVMEDHINFLYNCFLRIHIQPEDGYCQEPKHVVVP